MTAGTNNLTYGAQFLDDNTTISCFDLQYEALTGKLAQSDYCENPPPTLYDTCGCVQVPVDVPTDAPNDAPATAPTGNAELPTLAPTTSTASPDGNYLRFPMAGILTLLSIYFAW